MGVAAAGPRLDRGQPQLPGGVGVGQQPFGLRIGAGGAEKAFLALQDLRWAAEAAGGKIGGQQPGLGGAAGMQMLRSEEHTSELQSLMRISYAVFCLKKKKTPTTNNTNTEPQ